jgi:hypothetical protein
VVSSNRRGADSNNNNSSSNSKALHRVWHAHFKVSGRCKTSWNSTTRSRATRSQYCGKQEIWCGKSYRGCNNSSSKGSKAITIRAKTF